MMLWDSFGPLRYDRCAGTRVLQNTELSYTFGLKIQLRCFNSDFKTDLQCRCDLSLCIPSKVSPPVGGRLNMSYRSEFKLFLEHVSRNLLSPFLLHVLFLEHLHDLLLAGCSQWLF